MPNPNFYSIKAKADQSAEILIYGDIGDSWWGESVNAKDFVKEIAALDVKTLTVRINSNGGSVSDGIGMEWPITIGAAGLFWHICYVDFFGKKKETPDVQK